MKNHNSKLKLFAILILVFTFSFSVFNFSNAAGLVPCGPGGTNGGSPCTLCDFATLIHNVFNFVIGISVTLAIGFILYGGFLILTAADNPSRVSDGQKAIVSAILGMVIVLGAWLIVDTTLRIFLSSSPTEWGPWNNFPPCTSNNSQYSQPIGPQLPSDQNTGVNANGSIRVPQTIGNQAIYGELQTGQTPSSGR